MERPAPVRSFSHPWQSTRLPENELPVSVDGGTGAGPEPSPRNTPPPEMVAVLSANVLPDRSTTTALTDRPPPTFPDLLREKTLPATCTPLSDVTLAPPPETP